MGDGRRGKRRALGGLGCNSRGAKSLRPVLRTGNYEGRRTSY